MKNHYSISLLSNSYIVQYEKINKSFFMMFFFPGELTSEQIKQRDLLQKAWDVDGSPFKGQPFDPNIVQFQN